MDIKISIALVTRNRPESLERTLASISRDSSSPFEVIVSDDSTEEYGVATRDVAEKYGARYTEGPRRGLYANRNWAISQAAGTHVRTMDDDHEVVPGSLAKAQKYVTSDPDAIWLLKEQHADTYNEALEPATPPQFHPRGFAYTPQGGKIWSIPDGSIIYPPDIVKMQPLYAEFYPFGAVFYELGIRLFSLGYRFRIVPGTSVIHYSEEGQRTQAPTQVVLGARYFSMVCQSFYYHPKLANRVMSLLQYSYERMKFGKLATEAWTLANRHAQAHMYNINYKQRYR